MTHSPNEDQDLVYFLRQHRPVVPPAHADLEQQILQQVKALSQEPQPQRWRFWVLPSIITAGCLASLAGYFILISRQPSTVELADLEDFIESSWQGAINQDSSSEPWYVIENITD
jgi:hypothetical protein